MMKANGKRKGRKNKMMKTVRATGLMTLLVSVTGFQSPTVERRDRVRPRLTFDGAECRPGPSACVGTRTSLLGAFGGFQASHEDAYQGSSRQPSTLSAVAIGSIEAEKNSDGVAVLPVDSRIQDLQQVLTTALLITGNTVGASALVLPEFASRPGFAVSAGMMGARGDDVPSSFKEFAETSLENPSAASAISGVSLFINTCVMAFDVSRAGSLGSELVGQAVDPTILAGGFGAVMAGLGMTQSSRKLSSVGSWMVAVLFASFSSLLVPGLAHVNEPLAAMLTPGTSPSLLEGMTEAAPIFLTTLIYQNIVPSVTKILDYDRQKTTAAIALGSFIPLAMYLAWCFAVLGGGIDTHVGLRSPCMTAFSMAAVFGSSLGSLMSISEELDSFGKKVSESMKIGDGFSVPSVLAAVGLPLAIACYLLQGADGSEALEISGSFGSPLLYGVVPVLMAWTQRQKFKGLEDLVPGGSGSLGVLGGAFGAFMVNEGVVNILHLF